MNREPTTPPEQSAEPTAPTRNKWLWTILFVLIAAVSIWAVTSQMKDFSPGEFWHYITTANPLWLLAALLGMLGFILFEGLALRALIRSFSHRCTVKSSFAYSAGDIYFSAITPSATGGQPASAYFMIKDGIPGALTAVILLINLVMYTLALFTIGVISILLFPSLLSDFTPLSQLLIGFGVAAQVVLTLFFCLLLKKGSIIERVGRWGINLLSKLKLVRNRDKAIAKLEKTVEEYCQASSMLRGHRKALIAAYFYNLFQRASQIAVTMFVFLATGGAPTHAFNIFAIQSYTVIGSNFVPIPGAMGVSDYLMLDGYIEQLGEAGAVNLELLSRSLSFYSCILICGIATVVKFQMLKKKQRRLS